MLRTSAGRGLPLAPIRTHLYSSTFWSARRPAFPLTEGHFVLRLNDPSLAFGAASAADLLHCYAHLRRAFTAVAGATAAQLYISLNWQPVGDAVGEPLAETSTPTLHVFFAFPDSTTAASALRLPAHQRVATAGIDALDGELRAWNGGTPSEPSPNIHPIPGCHPSGPLAGDPAPGADRSWEPEGWSERPFHIAPVGPGPGESFRGGHWTAVPRFRAASLDGAGPQALLELAGLMEKMHSHASTPCPSPPFQGVTVWATDEWNSPVPATLHLFARHHGHEPHQVADFVTGGGLDLPADRQLAAEKLRPIVYCGEMTNNSPLNEDQTAKALVLAMNLAREGKTAELAEFLDHGIPVDVQDPDGNTLLMLAAYKGQPATVSMLIDRGANVDIRNGRDQSPLAGALFKGEDVVCALLVAAGADLDAGTPSARAAATMFGREHLLG